MPLVISAGFEQLMAGVALAMETCLAVSLLVVKLPAGT